MLLADKKKGSSVSTLARRGKKSHLKVVGGSDYAADLWPPSQGPHRDERSEVTGAISGVIIEVSPHICAPAADGQTDARRRHKEQVRTLVAVRNTR